MSTSKEGPPKEGVLRLFQFPRFHGIPTVSPFAMKVETWLRLYKIEYENVFSFYPNMQNSRNGQIPFIMMGDEEIADSNFIIKELTKRFNITERLTDAENGVAHSIEMMLDNNTSWSYIHHRVIMEGEHFFKLFTFLGSVMHFVSSKIMRHKIGNIVTAHGIGRHSPEEIAEIGCEDIRAVSQILGDKTYLFGDKMTTADCYVFAHLVQIFHNRGVTFPHLAFMRERCTNLEPFVERIKNELWPDWEAECSQEAIK